MEQKARKVVTMLWEMQKFGFSLIQADCARRQPLDDQLEQARAVARQLLDVADDVLSHEVDRVAKVIIDVSTRTARDGSFLPQRRPPKVACLYIPFGKDLDPQLAHESATEACNARIARDGLDVMNIETVVEQGFFVGVRQIGLVVWHRVP